MSVRTKSTMHFIEVLRLSLFVCTTIFVISEQHHHHAVFVQGLQFNIPFPGGKSISYNSESGVLRINLDTQSTSSKNAVAVPPITETASMDTISSITVRDTKIPNKGYGAFATKSISKHTFLGFYEGTTIHSRENLDRIVESRRSEQSEAININDTCDNNDNAMDYVMSLDGGATFLDGYIRAMDRSLFSPVHLNHADKNTEQCNCFRILEDNRIAFFTARDIKLGEELCFDYGSNFWSGREHLKV